MSNKFWEDDKQQTRRTKMNKENQIKQILEYKKEDLRVCLKDLDDIRDEVNRLASRETVLLTRVDTLKEIIESFEEILSNGKPRRKRTTIPRKPDAVVRASEAIPLIIDYLEVNKVTKNSAIRQQNLFEHIQKNRPGWENSYGSFSAAISNRDICGVDGAKQIGVLKVKRTNYLYLKYFRRSKGVSCQD